MALLRLANLGSDRDSRREIMFLAKDQAEAYKLLITKRLSTHDSLISLTRAKNTWLTSLVHNLQGPLALEFLELRST